MYHVKALRGHIEFGDVGDERHGEILPHPYCDFCEEFLFNDLDFYNHVNRNHLTCHLCGEYHKNIYYKEYPNLESHFTKSHNICPYEICKAKCYVAFKTEDELRTHLDIEHNKIMEKGGKIKANALLGFQKEENYSDDEGEQRGGFRGRGRGRGAHENPGRDIIKIKDTEGVDFSFYFGPKYAQSLEKKRKQNEMRR